MPGKRFICLITLMTVISAIGVAQTVQPLDAIRTRSMTIGVGPQVGFFSSSGADKGAFYLGGAIRVRLGSILGLEGAIGYRGAQTFNFGIVQGADLSAQTHTVPVTASVLLYLPLQGAFQPYVIGGLGLYMTNIDYSADINKVMGDETSTKVAFHLGVGVELPITGTFSIQADYRYSFLNSIFGGNGTYDFSGINFRGGGLMAGLLVYF